MSHQMSTNVVYSFNTGRTFLLDLRDSDRKDFKYPVQT